MSEPKRDALQDNLQKARTALLVATPTELVTMKDQVSKLLLQCSEYTVLLEGQVKSMGESRREVMVLADAYIQSLQNALTVSVTLLNRAECPMQSPTGHTAGDGTPCNWCDSRSELNMMVKSIKKAEEDEYARINP